MNCSLDEILIKAVNDVLNWMLLGSSITGDSALLACKKETILLCIISIHELDFIVFFYTYLICHIELVCTFDRGTSGKGLQYWDSWSCCTGRWLWHRCWIRIGLLACQKQVSPDKCLYDRLIWDKRPADSLFYILSIVLWWGTIYNFLKPV